MHALAAGSIGNGELPRRYRTSRFNLNANSPQGSITSEKKNNGKPKIIINISGMIYETYASTLDKYPDTLLGTPLKRSLITDSRTRQIYLERNRAAFEAILFYYQSSGCLIRPCSISMLDFEKECVYFDLPQEAVKRMKCRDGFLHKRETKLPAYKYYRDFQYTLWQFFEYPKEFCNRSAMAYFVFSFAMIVMSIAIFCVESEILLLNWKGVRLKNYYHIQKSIEMALNVYFAIELLVRLFATPIKKRFFEKLLNNIEITSVVLYLGAIWCPPHFVTKWAISLSRILRAFRISRLARASDMIKTSILVFKSSVNDILAVWFTILIICVLCGSTMYYIEMSEPGTNFTSIPMSMWWAMQTVLCLGYGDIVPTSVIGKIMGAAMLYYGVVTVMVLVLALGSRFFDMYAKFLNKDSWLPEDNNKEQDLSFP